MEPVTANKIPRDQQYYCPSHKNANNINPIWVSFSHGYIIGLAAGIVLTSYKVTGIGLASKAFGINTNKKTLPGVVSEILKPSNLRKS